MRDEAANIRPLFESLARNVSQPAEVLLVYDTETDPSIPAARSCEHVLPWKLQAVQNKLGPGPANAIRCGFHAAAGDAIVVVMADLSDDLGVIDRMYSRIQDGDDVVCGSRYMRGGRQIGGPYLKRMMSYAAGTSLWWIGLPTHDATNAFKMYRTSMLRELSIEGDGGFEISLEIVIKAWLAGRWISELPATWTDRTAGRSKFRLLKWLPRYLRWYAYGAVGKLRRGLAGRASGG